MPALGIASFNHKRSILRKWELLPDWSGFQELQKGGLDSDMSRQNHEVAEPGGSLFNASRPRS